MKPAEIMSQELVSVFDSTSTRDAFKAMKENQFRHLLVRDKSLRLVGVLSDRDLLRAPNIDGNPVSHYMTRSIQSVDLQEDLAHALKIMLDKEISCIIVTDQSRPIGILTSYDAIQLLIQILEKENIDPKPKLIDYIQKTANEVAVQLARIGVF